MIIEKNYKFKIDIDKLVELFKLDIARACAESDTNSCNPGKVARETVINRVVMRASTPDKRAVLYAQVETIGEELFRAWLRSIQKPCPYFCGRADLRGAPAFSPGRHFAQFWDRFLCKFHKDENPGKKCLTTAPNKRIISFRKRGKKQWLKKT